MALYTEPILFNNGAGITQKLELNQAHYGTSSNEYQEWRDSNKYGQKPLSIWRDKNSCYGRGAIDLKPAIDKVLNNIKTIKRLRVSFDTRFSGIRAYQYSWTDKDRDNNIDEGELNSSKKYYGNQQKGVGASMDISIDNIIESTRWKHYTVDIIEDSILIYNLMLTLQFEATWGSKGQVNSTLYYDAEGTFTIFNITIEQVEYEPDYNSVLINLSINKNKFKYGVSDSVTFSYNITEFSNNRLVSWELHKAGYNGVLAKGTSLSGQIPMTLEEAAATSPYSIYYIQAKTEKQVGVRSNQVRLDIQPGEAEIDIVATPPYLRYQDAAQTINGVGYIRNLGGISRDWAINKKLNDNHVVLDTGNHAVGTLEKKFTDSVNPYNTIAPAKPGDNVEYGMLCTNNIPVQSKYVQIPILEYNVDKLGIDETTWKNLKNYQIVIPPYIKKRNSQKTLVKAFSLTDENLNAASKVGEYRFTNWGGLDVAAHNTIMDGIMDTKTPTQLFILDNDQDENRTTAARTLNYHLYLTRADKNWDSTKLIFKNALNSNQTFVMDGVSYANILMPVTYRIDKLKNPTGIKAYRSNQVIDATTGDILNNKQELDYAGGQQYFYSGQELYIQWNAVATKYAAIGGFTIEIYNLNTEKKLYSEYIDWTQVITTQASNGRGYGYKLKLPEVLDNAGTCILNIVAINEYNNSIKNRRKDGFTWADSQSGQANGFKDGLLFYMAEKRKPAQIVAPVTINNERHFTFKYPRNPFIIFGADSSYLDLHDTVPVPIFDANQGYVNEVEVSPVNKIWYNISIGTPEYNWFDYWHPYKDLTWEGFQQQVIKILCREIDDRLLDETMPDNERALLVGQKNQLLDAQEGLIWDYTINGCRKLWDAYKDNELQFVRLFGLWKDIYEIISDPDGQNSTYGTWKECDASINSWKSWTDLYKTWQGLKEANSKKLFNRKWEFKFALVNDDKLINVGEGKDYPHSILGKYLDAKDSDIKNYIFYDELHDTIGFQFLSLLKKAMNEFKEDSNMYKLLAFKLAHPDRRYNIEITSAYGYNDTIYQTTVGESVSVTLTSTDLIEYAMRPEEVEKVINKDVEKIIPGNAIYNSNGNNFGHQMAYLLDMMNDICLYYEGKESAVSLLDKIPAFSYNDMARVAAYGLKYSFNPYPEDIIHPIYHEIPKQSLRQRWYDFYLSGFAFDENDSEEKDKYTNEQAAASIYNNNNFTNSLVLQYLFRIVEDQ